MKEVKKQTCEECHQSFIPRRSDQLYCSASCRYAHNNAKAADEQYYFRDIDKFLHENYRILNQILGVQPRKLIDKHSLRKQGYSFKYHTHTMQVDSNTYEMVYRLGLRRYDGQQYELISPDHPALLKDNLPTAAKEIRVFLPNQQGFQRR